MLVWYGNFPKKQNLDFLKVITCENWVSKVEKKQKFGFYRDFFIFKL